LSDPGAEGGWLQIRIPEERAEQARKLGRVILREPFQKRTWAELGYFLASSVLAIGAVWALLLLGVSGVLLTVAVVGIFVLAGGLRAARGLGRWQRILAWTLLGDEIAEPEPFAPAPGVLRWLRAAFTDPAARQAALYFAAKVPLTLFGTWFALSIWVEAFFGIASLFGSQGAHGFGLLGRASVHSAAGGGAIGFGVHIETFLLGVIFLFIAPWTMRFVVFVDRRIMVLLLGPNAASSRVRSLEASRSRTLDATTETLQRIERNLHDGTQAQLVALAMRLGQAKERLETLNVADDEEGDLRAVRRLVEDAHQGAKEAITDLRDLARGIHPPALDTGLENALATLASRSTVPTDVLVTVPSRPSPAMEAIAYFCAAELLANIAQHAEASRASVSCAQHGPWMRVAVRDDGHGGAAVNRVGSTSSGLAGLADRVEAVDGHLAVTSPPGGPTVVTVDLPLHA
jgi:signal transduction histidine kinase